MPGCELCRSMNLVGTPCTVGSRNPDITPSLGAIPIMEVQTFGAGSISQAWIFFICVCGGGGISQSCGSHSFHNGTGNHRVK